VDFSVFIYSEAVGFAAVRAVDSPEGTVVLADFHAESFAATSLFRPFSGITAGNLYFCFA